MAMAGNHMRRLRDISDRDVPHLHANFLAPAEAFDATDLHQHRLFPLEMTWFYGEPIYLAMTPAQQTRLNHLSFCQSYYSTALAEAATNVLNYESSVNAILAGDTDDGIYMANEVLEESVHLKAFFIVIQKVLAYHGLTIAELHHANASLSKARDFQRLHSLIGWLRGNLDFYYFTRFALNVNQKTVERCIIDEPQIHPTIRTLLKNHAIDEARHMQMSRETGRRALARMSSPMRIAAGLAYGYFAARVYIARHSIDGRLPAETRIRTLQLCGVRRAPAEQAYRDWQSRMNQPNDPPLARAGRAYYLRQNLRYIEALELPAWVRATMRRSITQAYRDVAGAVSAEGELEFAEIAERS